VGNGLGQLIQFSSILLLSRLYTPADFGVLGQIQSYATVLAILCTLQLHLSLPLAKNSKQAKSLVSTIILICCVFVLAAAPIAFWMGKTYLYALLLSMFVGLSNTFNGYLVFGGNFGNISRFYVFRSLAIVLVQSGLGMAGTPDGLIWGALGGEGLTATYLFIRSQHSAPPLSRGAIRRVLNALKEHRAFALFGTLQEVVSVSAFYAPLFFFAHLFDDAVAGQYSMASRLVWAPTILFTSSLTQVLYHELGKKSESARLPFVYLKLPHVAFYPMLVVAPLGCYLLRDLVVWGLGDKWQMTADMLPLVVAWGAVFVVSAPARAVCRMLRQQKVHLLIDLGMLAAIALTFYVVPGSPINAMVGIFIVATIQNLLMIMTAWTAMKAMPVEGRPA
jgi:O-antigen/teichoic acid export membrane protein